MAVRAERRRCTGKKRPGEERQSAAWDGSDGEASPLCWSAHIIANRLPKQRSIKMSTILLTGSYPRDNFWTSAGRRKRARCAPAGDEPGGNRQLGKRPTNSGNRS